MALIKQNIFVYRIGLPLSSTMTSRVKINLINSTGLLDLTSVGGHPQTEWTLEIKDASMIGVTSSDQLEQGLRDIVLAMNMSLSRIAITLKGAVFREAILEMSGITERVNVVSGTDEDLDERLMLSNLSLINKIDRHSLTSLGSDEKHNLAKALSEYEKALDNLDSESAFKHLFNALENATNWDMNREGSDLDKEALNISGVPQSTIETWRKMYARLKHPDVSGDQRQAYLDSKSKVQTEILSLRPCVNKILITRLNQLT